VKKPADPYPVIPAGIAGIQAPGLAKAVGVESLVHQAKLGWRFLPCESPGRERVNPPPVSRVAPLEETVKTHCGGAAYLCRYADDFVYAFELEADAERFYGVLGDRLGKFGLEVAAEKTNWMQFSPQNWKTGGAFSFLGFEFRWGRGRWCKPVLKRRTDRKKYRAALANFQEWCRENWRLPKQLIFKPLQIIDTFFEQLGLFLGPVFHRLKGRTVAQCFLRDVLIVDLERSV